MADNGGFVDPKKDCPHVAEHIKELAIEAAHNVLKSGCHNCGDESENWMCASCHVVGCARYVAGHMISHNESTQHAIATSLRDLNTWCYACESYITHEMVDRVRQALYFAKFGQVPAKPKPSARFDSSNEELTAARARIAAGRTEYPEPSALCTTPVAAEPDMSRPGAFGHTKKDDIVEYEDSDDVLRAKVHELSGMIRDARHVVAYTGAGISTSAKIPDYRGPKGVWTRAAQAGPVAGDLDALKLEQACPTSGHMAMAEMLRRGSLKYIVSTNIDGLHRRSGVAADQISELHGNCYLEICRTCHKEYHRLFNVTNTTGRDHMTTRRCDCGQPLYDNIINFGEALPTEPTLRAFNNAESADVALVLGTSMLVAPACKMPETTFMKGGRMVIVNLQKTPYDEYAALRIFARTDRVLELLAQELEFAIPEYHVDEDELAPVET